MVTLSLLKLLEQNGFGTIDQDLYWEKLGLYETGIYITDLGNSRDRANRQSTMYQIFSRGVSDVEGYQKLEAIAEFLNKQYSICKLPSVPPITNYGYENVSIQPVSTISSNGVDMNGRVIWSITGQIYYGNRVYDAPPPVYGEPLLSEIGKAILTENQEKILTEEEL